MDADRAREEAERILSQDKYQPARRGPAEGLLERFGDWLVDVFGPVLRPIGRALGAVWESLFGRLTLLALGLAVVAVIVVLIGRRRRVRAVGRLSPGALFAEDDDPDVLEAEARRAAAAGDHGRAVRLRFRAGLVRLHRGGKVRIRPSMTTREIGRAVASERFDDLGRTFDRVVYGDDEAAPADSAAAEDGWRSVLVDVGRRP